MTAYYKTIIMKAIWNCHSNRSTNKLNRVRKQTYVYNKGVCVYICMCGSPYYVQNQGQRDTLEIFFFLIKGNII